MGSVVTAAFGSAPARSHAAAPRARRLCLFPPLSPATIPRQCSVCPVTRTLCPCGPVALRAPQFLPPRLLDVSSVRPWSADSVVLSVSIALVEALLSDGGG